MNPSFDHNNMNLSFSNNVHYRSLMNYRTHGVLPASAGKRKQVKYEEIIIKRYPGVRLT